MDVSIVPGQTESQEVRQATIFYFYKNYTFSDEYQCKNQQLLILEDTWTVLDISLVNLVITTILVIIIVIIIKYYRYQRQQEVTVLPRQRELPRISPELLSSCPPPPPLLPPPYSIENISHYMEQDATKPPNCDLILQHNE